MNSKLNELTLKGENLGAFFAPYLCYSSDGSKRYTLFLKHKFKYINTRCSNDISCFDLYLKSFCELSY